MKLELPHRNDRVFRTRSHDIIRSEDPQTFAGDRQTFDERHLQVVQLHTAVEAGAEGFDNPSFENRCRSLQHTSPTTSSTMNAMSVIQAARRQPLCFRGLCVV